MGENKKGLSKGNIDHKYRSALFLINMLSTETEGVLTLEDDLRYIKGAPCATSTNSITTFTGSQENSPLHDHKILIS
jgi:hypothetical protein